MSARIFGIFKDSVTGATIITASAAASPYFVTNVNGVYLFLTPGSATVKVTASAYGYVSQSKTVTVANGQMKLLNFSLVAIRSASTGSGVWHD